MELQPFPPASSTMLLGRCSHLKELIPAFHLAPLLLHVLPHEHRYVEICISPSLNDNVESRSAFFIPFQAIMLMCTPCSRVPGAAAARRQLRVGSAGPRRSELGEVIAGENLDGDVTRHLGCVPAAPAPQPQRLQLGGITGGRCQHRLPQELVTQELAVPDLRMRGHKETRPRQSCCGFPPGKGCAGGGSAPLTPWKSSEEGLCV